MTDCLPELTTSRSPHSVSTGNSELTSELTLWRSAAHRCPGLFYGTPAQDGVLIRIRTPGGLLNHQQARAIARILKTWGQSTVQVTNRANLQIRAITATPSAEVFQTLQTLGLAAQDPQVDHLRNLMASPTAGIDPQELIDPRPWIKSLDAYIQNHPELAGLPAKFSIGLDGGGAVGIGTRSGLAWEHRYNEIQLSAVPHSKGITEPIGWRLALSTDRGLQGTQVLIPEQDCLSVVAALTTVYLEYVHQAVAAQKPRMKHLLQDWGWQRYLEQVNYHLPQPLQQIQDLPNLLPTRPYGHLGVHAQRQLGRSYVGINLRLGHLSAEQLLGLAQLAEDYGQGQLRLTPWQTLLLPDVADAQVPVVLRHLSRLGWVVESDRFEHAIVACAGKPGCAAAFTQTQTHAMTLSDRLAADLSLERPVNIHLTGCIKSCAQPSPAEITLLGTSLERIDPPASNSQTALDPGLDRLPGDPSSEGYHIYLGEAQQSLKYLLGTVAAVDMPAMIEQMLHLYQQHRQNSQESLVAFSQRYGLRDHLVSGLIPDGSIPQPFSSAESR